MITFYETLVLFLLFPSLVSSDDSDNIKIYNLSLGIPLNITPSKLYSTYLFKVEAKYPKILRIKIIIPRYIILFGGIYMIELKEQNEVLYKNIDPLYYDKYTIKTNPDKSKTYLFYYEINKPDTKFCYIEYSYYYNLDYFYIIADLNVPYELPTIGITKTFFNISELFYNYFFINGVERFQRMNITMTAKGKDKHPFSSISIAEYAYRTEEFGNYASKNNIIFYDYKTISEDENIYEINFICDIELYPTVVLFARFKYDLYYLNLKVEVAGGAISFEDNSGIINITNLKGKNPYYFFVNAAQYQTAFINLITKYYEKFPFDEVKIYQYKNKSDFPRKIIYNEIIINPIFNNEQLNISFSYQMNESGFTDIGFRFIPNFDLDYVFGKLNVMGGVYQLKEEDIKKIYNIFPGNEISFWIKSLQNETIFANLKYSYLEKNPLNVIDIYEKNSNLDNSNNNYYKHIKHTIIPKKINNNTYSTNFSHIIENSGTKYILYKINPNNFLEFLTLTINIHKREYDLINNTPIKINNINPGNFFNFFINATIYNELFIKLIFNTNNKDSIKYITVNEYEKRNDLLAIKSTNKTFDIIKKENESLVELIYKPMSPYCKYIVCRIESNSKLDYLITQIDIGGGYYEFNRDSNITKLIAGTLYNLFIKISPIQKIEMRIIIDDDNINIAPFSFANIYEKEKKEDNSYNKYYNQSLKIEKIDRKLVQYFSYPTDHLSTKYILIELNPNINLEKIQIKFSITNIYNQLNNSESININKLLKNIPYYYFINSKEYQQVIFNITLNNSQTIPFEFVEIYEYSEKYNYNTYNKFTNKSLQFISNMFEGTLSNSFHYIIESIYTNFIIIKIKPKIDYENLNIKVNVGGGYYDIDKGYIKNIENLFVNYSYYLFVLSSKGDKLNINLRLNSIANNKPFYALNILEYSSKNLPSFYLERTNIKFNIEIKDNKSIIYMSYLTKNDSTNFIALEMIPNYNLSTVECLIDLEIEDKNQISFSFIKILVIILIGIIIITVIIFIIYIKKVCLKSSSNEIENLYQNRDNENKNEKKFELALLPIDPKSSSN